MSYEIKLELPAEAVKETLIKYLLGVVTADPALLVTATSGNAVTLEEKYAEANAAVPTAGSVAANAAALATFLAAYNGIISTLAGNPLGEGVEGVALAALVQNALSAVGLPTGVEVYAGAVVPPASVSNTSSSVGSIQVDLADFVGLLLATLQLARSRTILLPNFTVNGK